MSFFGGGCIARRRFEMVLNLDSPQPLNSYKAMKHAFDRAPNLAW